MLKFKMSFKLVFRQQSLLLNATGLRNCLFVSKLIVLVFPSSGSSEMPKMEFLFFMCG